MRPLRRVNKRLLDLEVGEYMQYPLHVAWGFHRWWLVSETECSNRESSRGRKQKQKPLGQAQGIPHTVCYC